MEHKKHHKLFWAVLITLCIVGLYWPNDIYKYKLWHFMHFDTLNVKITLKMPLCTVHYSVAANLQLMYLNN